MFGTNEIVGKSYFKNAKKGTLLVTSMFYTLQGEGPFTGHPAYFIRFTKCNLACGWCDSFFDRGTTLTFYEILIKAYQDIQNFTAFTDKEIKDKVMLVITGGEPLLQNNLYDFIHHVKYSFSRVQIESNGIATTPLDPNTILIISPKCLQDDSGRSIRYLKPNKNNLDKAHCLKFVMCAPNIEKYLPYSTLPTWALEWKNQSYYRERKIYLSPMNIYKKLPKKSKGDTIEERSDIDETISFWEPGLLDMEQNKKNHQYTAEYCMKTGCILSLQTHLYASLP